uniref:Reverse transcriptase Ty1/copia-type domain-containing protein n=1 Tax=Solanum lycopersicum TaxID=4081 RepID=A0A3Q7J7U8_SOLLC
MPKGRESSAISIKTTGNISDTRMIETSRMKMILSIMRFLHIGRQRYVSSGRQQVNAPSVIVVTLLMNNQDSEVEARVEDLGPARQILGMKIVRHREAKKFVLSQENYIQKVLCRFGMDKAKVIRKPILCGYTDSDMASDVDTRKSTSGYLVTFAGRVVSWQSRLQKCVALSTTEAELIVVVEACKELL